MCWLAGGNFSAAVGQFFAFPRGNTENIKALLLLQ
jgi:hypothetical protein